VAGRKKAPLSRFRAREELVGGLKGRQPPPSHILSKGGAGGWAGRNTTQKGGGG